MIWLVFLLLFSCSASSDMTSSPDADKHAYTYLALGDSYTIGESVGEKDRWPVQLAGMLRSEGVDVAPPDIIARTGWTTAELQAAIRASGNQKTYDLVSLLIGVNNQYRGQSAETYRTEFQQLLQAAIQFAGRRSDRVFVLSIPDWGRSPFAAGRDQAKIAAEIDQFNTVARAECAAQNIPFVDITPLSRQAAGNNAQFANDGLHYSGAQMRQWAELAKPVAQRLLTR